MTTHWSRSEENVWEELDGEVVVVQPRTGRAWLLNATAAYIWRCCDGQMRPEEIAHKLVGGARRKIDQIDTDIQACCAELESAGLWREARCAALSALEATVAFKGPYLPPSLRPQSFGAGPRQRPGPRGLSGGPG